MIRRLPAVLAVAVLLVAGTAAAATDQASAGEQWLFTVYLDGKKIGYHHFALEPTPAGRRLTSEARFTVRLLSIPVYRYRHDAVEQWQGSCLQRIESATDDNGDALSVLGRAREGQFVVDRPDGRATLPGCVMSFAYWDSRILQADRLLNAQNGEYLEVRVSDLGVDPLKVADGEVNARRYRLQGRELQIDLWYSDDRRWLALESRTPSGDTLYYERQNIDAHQP